MELFRPSETEPTARNLADKAWEILNRQDADSCQPDLVERRQWIGEITGWLHQPHELEDFLRAHPEQLADLNFYVERLTADMPSHAATALGEAIGLMNDNPHYAHALRGPLSEVTDLIPAYSAVGGWLRSTDGAEDSPLMAGQVETRLSTSDDAAVVNGYLERAAEYHRALNETFALNAAADTSNWEQTVATVAGGEVEIWLGRYQTLAMKIAQRRFGEDHPQETFPHLISLRVSNTGRHFLRNAYYQLQLSSQGLISTVIHSSDYHNLGYRFRTERGLDEEGLISTLIEHPHDNAAAEDALLEMITS